MRSEPDFADNWYEAGWLLLEHEQGQAHSDMKVDNMTRHCVSILCPNAIAPAHTHNMRLCCGQAEGTISHVTWQGDIHDLQVN